VTEISQFLLTQYMYRHFYVCTASLCTDNAHSCWWWQDTVKATYKRLDVLEDNFVTGILIELRHQLGVTFAFLAQQVELLLLVTEQTRRQHSLSPVRHTTLHSTLLSQTTTTNSGGCPALMTVNSKNNEPWPQAHLITIAKTSSRQTVIIRAQ